MNAETYQTRLIDNACTGAASCRRPPEDGASQCKKHLRAARKRAKLYQQRLRGKREAAGQCGRCGTPRKTGQRCAVCTANRPERLPVDAIHAEVHADTDQWRRDNDGWKRYRGKGRRGAPGAAVNDEQDLVDATKALEKGRQALAYARSPEVQALPRIQRAGVTGEATGFLAHAARFLDEVVERNTPRAPKGES